MSSNKTVYLDFGSGFVDISHLVIYDTLTINRYAFNDGYKSAQSECSLSLKYNAVLFGQIIASTSNIPIKVTQTLNGSTTNIFYGHIPYNRNWKYNGIDECTIVKLDAVDNLDYLNKAVGEVIYTNCAVCNPLDTSHSIVHLLAAIAGFTVNSSVTISTVIAKFAPSDEEDYVYNVLDTLLYEYGYSLHIDNDGYILPVKWNIAEVTSVAHTFDETNIIDEVSVVDKAQTFDSVEVTHYELGSLSKVRLYTDENSTYDDKGEFVGYAIANGNYYPPKANVIDGTTGTNQVVHQEYTSDAIEYLTNKAIVQKLDYNYKNYDSDFSAIVATENHFLERRFSAGITLDRAVFGNKKAEIRYLNSTGDWGYMYYNNIYGDVWYKTSERKITIYPATSDNINPKKVTLGFVYDPAIANAFALGLAKQIEVGNIKHTFSSEDRVFEGSLVRILLDNGTDTTAFVQKVQFSEKNELYYYDCVSTSFDRGSIVAQTALQNVTIYNEPSYILTASSESLAIPYGNGAYDYSGAYIDLFVYKNGVNYTQDWTLAIIPSGITGSFTGNRYTITDVAASGGILYVTASKANRNDLTMEILVTRSMVSEAIEAITEGTPTDIPSNVGTVSAIASMDGITISWSWSSIGLANSIDHFTVDITKDGGSNWESLDSVSTNSAFYTFNRDIDGYPSVADLSDWDIRVKAINIYGLASASYSSASVSTTTYIGWTPVAPSTTTRINGRGLSIGWGFASDWYGRGDIDIQIAKGYTVVAGEVVLITNPASLVAYAPATGVDPTLNYDNYKEGATDGYLSRGGNAFFMALPLYGQNENPIVSRDTPYYIRVRGSTDTPTTLAPSGRLTSAWTNWELVYTQATSAQDIIRAWTLNDNGEKVEVEGALGAHQLYAEFLAAISANLGVITDGAMVGNENNLWALSRIMEDDGVTTRYYEGTVKMGGEDQYLHVNPIVQNGVVIGYNIDFRVGNFTVTAVGSIVNGKFEVRNLRGDRVYFTVDPENKGLVTVEKQLKVGPYALPLDGINVQESYGTTALAFTGTGVNDMEVTEEGTVDGNFEVEITNDGDGVTWELAESISGVNEMKIGNGYALLCKTDGIYRSIDDGFTWTLQQATSIAEGLAISSSFCLASGNNNIYKSTDEGVTWVLQQTLTSKVTTIDIGLDFCLLGTFSGEIYKSVDAGVTWTLQQDLGGYSIDQVIVGNTICIAVSNVCYKSTNDGVTWSVHGGGLSGCIAKGDSFYLGSTAFGKEIYKSDDEGASWVSIWSDNITPTYRIRAIAIGTNYCLFSGSDGGVYKSTDDGVTWVLQDILSVSTSTTSVSISDNYSLAYAYNTAIYTVRFAQARWRETSGAWSDPFAIGPTYSTELTGYGITIGFATIAGHVLADKWTFSQGPIGALSARDRAGTEYFALREGLVKNPSFLVTAGAVAVPDCEIGAIIRYIKTDAYSGTGAVFSPPSGATFEGRASISLYGQYSFVEIERISATVFAIRDLNDEFAFVPSVGIDNLPGTWVVDVGKCQCTKGKIKSIQIYEVSGPGTGQLLLASGALKPAELDILVQPTKVVFYDAAPFTLKVGVFSYSFSSEAGVCNATIPFTWASGDTIFFESEYIRTK